MTSNLSGLLARGHVVSVPGVHDPLTARVAVGAGHEAVYLGGNAAALGLGKGQPYITLTETAAVVAGVSRAVPVPVIVDGGAGFGDLSHLTLAVRELEHAGASAIHFDDQPYPKTADYHRGRGQLVDTAAFAARIGQAVAARRSAETAIIARTDALRVTGSLDAVLERAAACRQAGADALIVLDLGPDRAVEVRRQAAALPLIWIGGVHPPVPTLAELSQAGFAAALYPFNGIAEVVTRLGEMWRALALEGHVPQDGVRLAQARQDTLALAGMTEMWAIIDASGIA